MAQLDGLPSLRQQYYVFLRHATLSKMVALSMAALELMVLACCSWLLFLAGCSCVFLGLIACRGPLVFCSLSPIQSLKTISVFLRSVFLRSVFLRYTFSYVTRFLTLHVFLRCVTSAYTMHFRGHSTSVVLRVCFIQQPIQDGIIIA